MQISDASIRSFPDLGTAGVQARIDAVTAHFSASPRGFTRAWCQALQPAVVGREALDEDYRSNVFSVSPRVTALAQADARLIADEIKRGGPATALISELETACILAGESITTYLPAHTDSAQRNSSPDAAKYFDELSQTAARWQRSIAGPTRIRMHDGSVGIDSFTLERMSILHHARLVSGAPDQHDARAIAAVAGARVAVEQDAARRIASAKAREIPASDVGRIVDAFTSGTLGTVHGVTSEQLQRVMAKVAAKIDAGDASSAGRFMQHFRESVHHGGITFADDATLTKARRGEFETPLKEACARKGLDYRDYNGIFDIDRFVELVEQRAR